MSKAYLAIVLHAHLPFVHHPEHERFLEEDWLFEGMAETYIPLLLVWERLRRDRVPFKITMSLTPPLLEMWAQPLLRNRFRRYLNARIDLVEKEVRNRRRSEQERRTARHYRERFRETEAYFRAATGGDLVAPFRELQDAGHLEVLGCPATHGFLPLMYTPNAVRAQIEVGLRTVERHMGRRPRGIWLPEMAFRPGIEEALAEEGIQYFIVDAHGIFNAYPVPPHGVHLPVRTPCGVVAFGRDLESSKQVWSADEGYPGDGAYREFYRDLGYDADYEEIEPYLHADGVRRHLGIKYHRITGRVALHEKQPYDRDAAVAKAREHGGHFVFCRQHQLRFLKQRLPGPPVVVAPYDAELFGHWWYEGPEFLEQVYRTAQYVTEDFAVCTLGEYLDTHAPAAEAVPSTSSWGDKGYFEVWLNGSNDWIYRHLHKAEERMVELARRYAAEEPQPPVRDALNQAMRELFLAQSSDWAFLMCTGTAAPYAEKRTRNHLAQFTRLYQMILAGSVDPGYVARLYHMNPIFPDADFRVFL